MTQLAVKHYVAEQAAGINLRGTGFTKLEALRQRVMDHEHFGECPVVEVGNVRRAEDRLAGSRGAGSKEDVWRVDVLVYLRGAHKDPTGGGDRFDVLVEAAVDLFRRLNPPGGPIADPVTGVQSSITYIGEHVDSDTLDPVPILDRQERITGIAFRALVTLEVHEVITA